MGQLRSGKAHCRSLGFARDDKGEGGPSRRNGLVAEELQPFDSGSASLGMTRMG